MDQQSEMQKQQSESQEKQLQMAQQFKAEEADKDRQNQITVAEIKAAGYGSMGDVNQNQQSDYLDAMAKIQGQQQYQDQMNLKREQHATNKIVDEQKLNLESQKLQTQREIANKQLQIARENKNKYDSNKSSKKK
jgi:hypothetical protein